MGCGHSSRVETAERVSRRRAQRRRRIEAPPPPHLEADASSNASIQSSASQADDEKSLRSRSSAPAAQIASLPFDAMGHTGGLDDTSDDFFRPRYPSDQFARPADLGGSPLPPHNPLANPLAESLSELHASDSDSRAVRHRIRDEGDDPPVVDKSGDGAGSKPQFSASTQPRPWYGDGRRSETPESKIGLVSFEDDEQRRPTMSDLGASATTASVDSATLALVREIEEQRPGSPSYVTVEPANAEWWQRSLPPVHRTSQRGVEGTLPTLGARPLNDSKKNAIASWCQKIETPARAAGAGAPKA